MSSLATALITGASSGIGAVYADRLARRGHDLILVARDAARLDALAKRLEAETGIKAEVFAADLSDRDDLGRIERRIESDDAIGLVVNNAGFGDIGDVLDSDPATLDRMVDVNVVAVNRLAIAAARAFAKRGTGAVVNIASVVAFIPEQVHATYSATKSFVLTLTQSLAAHVGDRGVKFQAVLPGATRTEFFDRAGGSLDRLPAEMLMHVDDLVDAALAGFDAGELVTIPSLPDPADWQALEAARAALGPNLSRDRPAARYGVRRAAA
ncbi:SDR family NAD(P)-dependent oxidoreductase [Methylobrevis albus]|uniref:SDR family oxidoreductase n=1 Tax=Methylobrevis albus TaxID=2793297 RepID=A0A931MXY1_9HYPH|nr:SDR family oxidoreductase [Methylobrevis albus]MBH0236499.1 SDR family oxidoreductase [Methylobrevis albus]